MKNTNRKTIKQLDDTISRLILELDNDELDTNERRVIEGRIEILVDNRVKLYENTHKTSLMPAIISGIFGMAAVILVLKYEEVNVITSKAFNMSTKMIEG